MSVNPELEAILDNEGADDSVIEAPAETDTPAIDLPATPDEPAPAEPEHPENVPWDDHVKLRHENEAYRKRFQPIEQSFKDVHPDDAEALLNLVKTYASNPGEAAAMMRQYADALSANDGEAVLDTEPDAPKYLTADELEKVLSRREAKQAETQAIAKYESDAVSLGYNPHSEDSVEKANYVALLSIASNNGGDLKAADAAMKAQKQQIIDAFLASKRAESESTPTPQMGSAPSGEHEIKSLKDADRAARELFASQ